MKFLKKIFLIGLVFILFMPKSLALEKNLVNIYLFYSETCPHCAEERELLSELEKEYSNIKIYKYEVNTGNNMDVLMEVAKLFDTEVTGVPFTIIGSKVYKGFSYDNSKAKYIGTIKYYSEYGYKDIVGEYIGGITLPSYEVTADEPEVEKYIDDYTSFKVKVPIFGTIDTKNLTLPVISILIGLVDGFNPCAMWVLLFLISVLIGMNDKRKMLILGITFILTSAIIYLLFMLTWLNVASLLSSVNWIRLVIGLIALIGGGINLRSYIIHLKDTGCDVVSDKKRTKIFDKVKKFTHERNFILAILGIMALAVSVNIVELACSAGLPVMFIEILSINNLSGLEKTVYIMLYMIFFLLDDLIVFIVAASTMQLTGFSTKYGKISKLVGGLLLVFIGILLIFKPEWIMFNFS